MKLANITGVFFMGVAMYMFNKYCNGVPTQPMNQSVSDKQLDIIREVRKLAMKDCAAIYPVTEEQQKSVMGHISIPDTPSAKCWLACLLEKFGMIYKGKVDWFASGEVTKMQLKDHKDKVKVDEIIELCKQEVNPEIKDTCELAYNVSSCLLNHSLEMDFPKPNW